MDFAYSEDQDALRELARKILEQFTGDRLKELEREADSFDRKVWRDLAEANLLGASLGEDVGGSGLGIWELSILLHEVGRSVAPLPILPTLAQRVGVMFGADPSSVYFKVVPTTDPNARLGGNVSP